MHALTRGFSRQHRITLLRLKRLRITSQPTWNTDLPMFRPTRLHQDNHRLAELPSCVTPSLDYYEIRSHAPQCQLSPKASPARFGWLVSNASSWAHMLGYGNINPLSIDYACRPRLRSRLTLGGLAWPRNPWSSGGRVSHSAFATHACILTPTPSTTGFRRRFPGCRTLPYPSTPLDKDFKSPSRCIA